MLMTDGVHEFTVPAHSTQKLLFFDQPRAVHATYRFILQDGAILDCLFLVMHSLQADITIEVISDDDDSNANVVLLYVLQDSQKCSVNTLQQHVGRRSKSTLFVRGMVQDFAQVSYRGLIAIKPGATGTYGQQDHMTIALSPDVKVISVPAIEVAHHDVQCLHGSSMGKFQQEQLWYLQTRGLSEQDAYRMLVHSFFAQYMQLFGLHDDVLESICKKII